MNNIISVNITDFAIESVIATSIIISYMDHAESSVLLLKVVFANADGHPVMDKTIILEGSEYAAWGNSDEYLTELVMERLGLTVRTA
jgi:hypothetical protein